MKESDAPSHHTPDFIIDDGALIHGVRVMTALTKDYLNTKNNMKNTVYCSVVCAISQPYMPKVYPKT